MRLHSTTESVKACEFTWLAVAECVVSTALYVAFACYRRTFRYYALAIALAPLALLRTDAAVDWALHRYSGHSALGVRMLREREYYAKWSPARLVPYAFLLFVLLLVWGFIYRVFSVGYWFLRQPLHAIRQVPKNWLRQALCVDLFSPPEIVPGEDAYKSELKFEHQFGEMIQIPVHSSMPTFRKVFLHQKDPAQEYMEKKLGIRPEVTPWTWQIFVVDYVFKSLLFVPAFLVSVAYRVSLKATCVVYAPFVWVAGFTAGSTDPLKMRLERITKGEIEKHRRWLAVIVLSMAVVKIALHFGWIGVPEATRDVLLESAKLVGGFIAPRTWTWWELGLVGDALLTFGLLYSADFVLSRIAARRKGYNTHKVADIFAAVTFVRAASALAIIGYFVWMAILSV